LQGIFRRTRARDIAPASEEPPSPSACFRGTFQAGAGEGNRTLVTSLEGWRSTIELHPLLGKLSSDSLAVSFFEACSSAVSVAILRYLVVPSTRRRAHPQFSQRRFTAEAGAAHSAPASCSRRRVNAFASGINIWWAGVDSNHCSLTQRIYSPSHLAALVPAHQH